VHVNFQIFLNEFNGCTPCQNVVPTIPVCVTDFAPTFRGSDAPTIDDNVFIACEISGVRSSSWWVVLHYSVYGRRLCNMWQANCLYSLASLRTGRRPPVLVLSYLSSITRSLYRLSTGW